MAHDFPSSPSSYYPLHYLMTRPYAREMVKQMTARGPQLPNVYHDMAADAVLPWLKTQGLDAHDPTQALAPFSQEAQGALAFGQWALNKRKLIHVHPELTDAFMHSDCGDMRISDVLAPDDPSMYVHFGPREEPSLTWGAGHHFEGAWVFPHPLATRVVLCSRSAPGVPPLDRWQERYDLRIRGAHLGVAADEAIDLALADDLEDLRQAGKAIEKIGGPGFARNRGDVELLIHRQSQGIESFRMAVRLLLNAMAYLKTERSDDAPGWPLDSPERLIEQAGNLSVKLRERAQSKLWGLSIVPLQLLGSEFARAVHQQRGAPGGLRRAHWRRGHWRNQPHGPQFSLRKLIWIRPQLIAATLSSETE